MKNKTEGIAGDYVILKIILTFVNTVLSRALVKSS